MNNKTHGLVLLPIPAITENYQNTLPKKTVQQHTLPKVDINKTIELQN